MDVRWITDAGVRPLPASAVLEVVSRGEGIVWIDLDHTDEEGLALLADLINVRPTDVEECHSRSPVPKLRAYTDHHFSAINGLARAADGRLVFQPLKTFLTAHLLFTVLGPTSSRLTADASRRDLIAVRHKLETGELCPRTGFDLILGIRFEMLRAHEGLVASAAGSVARLEQSVMQRDPVAAEAMLQDLFRLRHDLQTIRTNAAQTHELYVHLIEQLEAQQDLMRVDLRRFNELRQGFSHLKNTTDLEREYLQEVLDLFQTRVSTELNRFVRKITAFGTIGIAWTVIAGIYGMNFTHMPELNWQYGYPAVLAVMIVVGVVFATLFRKRGWL
jgi:magnesium transporter